MSILQHIRRRRVHLRRTAFRGAQIRRRPVRLVQLDGIIIAALSFLVDPQLWQSGSA
jgi:hypothetical protein